LKSIHVFADRPSGHPNTLPNGLLALEFCDNEPGMTCAYDMQMGAYIAQCLFAEEKN
jgi:hypothetical protein